MCGVSAYISNKPGDIDKLKILGIYNTTRGTDSCGVVVDDVVVKGVDNLANFTNFIENKQLRTHESHKNYTLLVHTRNASSKLTKSDPECAHPFEIKSKKGKTLLIGMHNGVITNETEIAKKYGVKEEKVDSKTLLSIIAKNRKDANPFKVLEDYEGAAVLLWYYPDEPNTLYIWKGASKSYTNSTTYNDERPLYMYRVKDDNGKFTNQIYLSSIKESLLAIGGEVGWSKSDEDKAPTVTSIEANCVIKIIPGEKFKVRKINRDQVGYTESSTTTHYPHISKSLVTTKETKKDKQEKQKELMLKTFKNYPFNKVNKAPVLNDKGTPIIEMEPFLHNFHVGKNKVYFLRGRYWQNGHMIGGNEFENFVTRELDMEGYPKDHELCSKDEVDEYYFFQGLLLKDKKSAQDLEADLKSNLIWKSKDKNKRELELTNIKKYVWGFCHNIGDKQGWAKDSKDMWAEGTYYAMFDYDRKFKFQNGFFVGAEYVALDAGDKLKIINSFEQKEETKIIPLTQTTYSREISEAMSAITDTQKDIIMNHCYDVHASMKSAIKVLEDYKDNEEFAPIYKLMSSYRLALSARLRSIEDKKQEDTNLTTEVGPLYS